MRALLKKPVWAMACVALSTSLAAQIVAPAHPANPDDTLKPNKDSERSMTQSRHPTRLDKASGLIGTEVKDAQGETLGKIDDVVIDFESGNVAYLVMSTGGLLGIGEKRLAVPLKAFTASADRASQDAHLMLRADKDSISRAEGIGDHWPSTRNPSFGAMPFWQEPRDRSTNPDVNPEHQPDPDPVREPERPRQLEPQE